MSRPARALRMQTRTVDCDETRRARTPEDQRGRLASAYRCIAGPERPSWLATAQPFRTCGLARRCWRDGATDASRVAPLAHLSSLRRIVSDDRLHELAELVAWCKRRKCGMLAQSIKVRAQPAMRVFHSHGRNGPDHGWRETNLMGVHYGSPRNAGTIRWFVRGGCRREEIRLSVSSNAPSTTWV